MPVSTKSRTVQMIGSSCSGANGGAWSGATIAIGSPVRWKRYTARICRSPAGGRKCMPNGSASMSAAAGAARSVIRSSIRMGLPYFLGAGERVNTVWSREVERRPRKPRQTSRPGVDSGFHGLPSPPVFNGHQPLLHCRGSHARLQGRGVRHAICAVPRPAGGPQGHRAGLRPDLDLGGETRPVVRHSGLPRKGPAEADPVPVGAEGPRGHPRALGPSSPRGARVAVRRHEGPAGPQERRGAMGLRRDADPRPRPVARPRDAPRGIPAGHEQAPRHGRLDSRRTGLDPRAAEPGGLRDLRIDVPALHGRRERAGRVPAARRLGFAGSGPRVAGGLRIASTRSAKATSRWTPDAMSRTVALVAFSSFSPSNTAYRAPIAFA